MDETSAAKQSGSNAFESLSMISYACLGSRALLYGRTAVIASNTSQTVNRLVIFVDRPHFSISGYPPPSKRRWWPHAAPIAIGPAFWFSSRIRAPSTGCFLMTWNSSFVSLSGL